MSRKYQILTDSKSDHITQDGTENQTEDGNNFSVTAMTDSVRQWAQGASGSLQNMIHRVSTATRPIGADTFPPFSNALPKAGFISVP